jgi:hypothetical protein
MSVVAGSSRGSKHPTCGGGSYKCTDWIHPKFDSIEKETNKSGSWYVYDLSITSASGNLHDAVDSDGNSKKWKHNEKYWSYDTNCSKSITNGEFDYSKVDRVAITFANFGNLIGYFTLTCH